MYVDTGHSSTGLVCIARNETDSGVFSEEGHNGDNYETIPRKFFTSTNAQEYFAFILKIPQEKVSLWMPSEKFRILGI